MCAIFGSPDTTMVEILYQANKERGNFASSIVQLTEYEQHVLKKEGDIDFEQIELDKKNQYYLGHVQAPTSSQRKWHYDTSHPFETMSWMVFHNGVITNEEAIRNKNLSHILNPVDTALIVNLIQLYMERDKSKKPNPIKYIKKALEDLDGSFAVSIVDCDTNELYLARVGSALHYNNDGCFSTIPGNNYNEVPEGVILRLNRKTNRFNKVGTFKHTSPFLFI
jgi:glucosamine 6-phosphate synthetase-like amidotransferase/phosphosugar isomerase protein